MANIWSLSIWMESYECVFRFYKIFFIPNFLLSSLLMRLENCFSINMVVRSLSMAIQMRYSFFFVPLCFAGVVVILFIKCINPLKTTHDCIYVYFQYAHWFQNKNIYSNIFRASLGYARWAPENKVKKNNI